MNKDLDELNNKVIKWYESLNFAILKICFEIFLFIKKIFRFSDSFMELPFLFGYIYCSVKMNWVYDIEAFYICERANILDIEAVYLKSYLCKNTWRKVSEGIQKAVRVKIFGLRYLNSLKHNVRIETIFHFTEFPVVSQHS